MKVCEIEREYASNPTTEKSGRKKKKSPKKQSQSSKSPKKKKVFDLENYDPLTLSSCNNQ